MSAESCPAEVSAPAAREQAQTTSLSATSSEQAPSGPGSRAADTVDGDQSGRASGSKAQVPNLVAEIPAAGQSRGLPPAAPPPKYVFVFYNSASGDNRGSLFADKELHSAKLYFNDAMVYLAMWDITEGASRQKPGFLKLRSIADSFKRRRHPRASLSSALESSAQHVVVSSEEEAGGARTSAPTTSQNVVTANQESPPPSPQHRLDDDFVRVIAAGGDGTVMWCISELQNHGIDVQTVCLGVLPLGTGNDFARSLGWEDPLAELSSLSTKTLLRHLVFEWIHATPKKHDIWELVVDLDEFGTFKQIDPVTRSKKILFEVANPNSSEPPRPVRRKVYSVGNYFSIGVESRIGIGFDRYRTKNANLNRLRYLAEGIKKSIFKVTAGIQDTISRMLYETHDGTLVEVFHSPQNGDNNDSLLSTVTRIPGVGSVLHLNSRALFNSLPLEPDLQAQTSSVGPRMPWDNSMMPSGVARVSAPGGALGVSQTQLGRAQMITPDDSLRVNQNKFVVTSFTSHASTETTESAESGVSTLLCLSSMAGVDSAWHQCCPNQLKFVLKPAASLVMSNIPSFAGGLDIWGSARRLGIEPCKAAADANHRSSLSDFGIHSCRRDHYLGSGETRALNWRAPYSSDSAPSSPSAASPWSTSWDQMSAKLLKRPQRMGDGFVEFLTFPSVAAMGLERVRPFMGQGQRLFQGRGPFHILFKQMAPEARTYYQIDGEYFVMSCPKRITIRHRQRIRVLENSNFDPMPNNLQEVVNRVAFAPISKWQNAAPRGSQGGSFSSP